MAPSRNYSHSMRPRSLTFAGMTAALFTLTVLTTSASAVDAPISPSTWNAYAAAITDSAVSRPGEVVNDLLLPDPSDPRTQWRAFNGVPHLLVQRLSWRAATTVAPGEAFTLSGNTFVAVPEEVGEVCAEYKCTQLNESKLNLQLAQVLGLPPDAGYNVISRFWVKPSDLIRPCTNVDITVTSCPQSVVNTVSQAGDWSSFLFNQAMDSWRTQRTGTQQRISCANDFENKTKGNCFGYPWTRLGYTFDWTPAAKDDRGVTEFVVVKGSQAFFESFGTARTYYPYSRKS